ncbi:hypothetical protein Pla52n_48560 [Stieleria varia]|uniref:Uncharacterized protein n=1 Tax=Stieleria varia TaxID=2528005 RepID=A0A5C6AEE5_9BACT|nr:hypothetical protein Pla52n_48560 [Stieleria varia]
MAIYWNARVNRGLTLIGNDANTSTNRKRVNKTPRITRLRVVLACRLKVAILELPFRSRLLLRRQANLDSSTSASR